MNEAILSTIVSVVMIVVGIGAKMYLKKIDEDPKELNK